MEPLTLNRYAYGVNNPVMNIDPSGHWPKWVSKLGNKISSAASSLWEGTKKFASKAISAVKNTISSVKKNVSNWIASKSNNNSSASRYSTRGENRAVSTKAYTNNTRNRKQQLSTPQITTRDYPNEIVRNNIASIKKSCEGSEYISSKSYDYKAKILSVANFAFDFVQGMGAGITEGISFGVSSNLEPYYARKSEKTYIAGKIIGNGLTAIVGSFIAEGSAGAAIVTSPTGVGAVAFSGVAAYSASVTVSSAAHFTNNVAEFSKIKGDEGGKANSWNTKGTWGEESLQKHFEKHGKEVGAESVEQYLRKAEAFKQNLKGAKTSKVDGAVDGVIRYKKLGKYIDLAPDGTIVSFGKQ